MARQAEGRGIPAMAGIALLGANARFWLTVFPDVRRELRRWDRRARTIPDPSLRRQALRKLHGERFNSEVAATLATLAPTAHRRAVVTAIVAMEVMYDYLDALTEQPVAAPLDNGRQLYGAFADALSQNGVGGDRYRHHPHGDDGGYLSALAATCRGALWSLPAAAVTSPVALTVAARCGEAQTRTHAVASLGAGQLRSWAAAQAVPPGAVALRWWEVASGAAASVLATHALIALAADPATTPADARRIAEAYLTTCALTTLLDSLVDGDADDAAGGHAFLAYYRDDAEAAESLRRLARAAVAAARGLPRAPHHLVTVAGAVAFYLSAPTAACERARRITRPMVAELRPLIVPALAIFDVWRRAKSVNRRVGSARARRDRAGSCGRMKSRNPGRLGPMQTATETSAPATSAVAVSRTATRSHATRTLGRQLERDRLEQRATRVRQVIVALRERAAAREGQSEGAPRPLTAAIEDFGRELADLERRMRRADATR